FRVCRLMPLVALVLGSLVAAHGSTNHLSGQAAPYLKRAIVQPVDWYPWGPDAFKRARELNRPILLDMGAVWCGWCDLMDRESYNRPEVAAFINANFLAGERRGYDDRPLGGGAARSRGVVRTPSSVLPPRALC